MAGKTEQVKGQAKEAVGSLTGDKDLQAQGKAIVKPARPKRRLANAKDQVEEVVEKVEHKAEEVIDKAKDAAHRD